MSNQLLSTALTVVGYYFGGPFGAAIGSAIGYMLQPDPPKQYGPRLDDRRVQVSTYGAPIPLAYGAVRVAGNVIWSKDLEEVETETEVGGKGGPSQTQVIYTYFATFAVLIAKSRMRGIRRIWADAVLIFDSTVDNPAGFAVEFTWYPGSDEQLPDPTIEADKGVGNVPAYRGFAYAVFNRLPLERFGNRIPSITVEALADGAWEVTEEEIGTASAVRYDNAAQRLDGMVVAVGEPVAGTTRLSLIDPATGEATLTSETAIDLDSSGTFLRKGSVLYVPPVDEVWVYQGVGFEKYSAATLAHVGSVNLTDEGWNDAVAAYEPTKRRVVAMRASSQVGANTIVPITLDGFPGTSTPGMFFVGDVVTGGSSVLLGINGLHEFGVFELENLSLVAEQATTTSGNIGVWDAVHGRYVVASEQGLWTVSDANPPDIELHPVAGMFSSSSPDGMQYIAALNAYVVYSSVVGIITASVVDAETFELIVEDSNASTNGISGAFMSPDRPGTAFILGNYQPYNLTLFGTTVGAAVADLCAQSGLAPADINVSELTQTLRGYLVSQVAPARSAVEQLAQAFMFEGIEQDDVLYFRRRGGATVATITAAECGAGIDSAAAFPIGKGRAQEADLPAKLFVTAPDPYTDHQPGTQYSERQAAQAGDDEQVQLAVVLSVTDNRRLADALLFDRWASRMQRSWSTTRKHARLVPSDPVMLDGERVRIVSRSDEGSFIRWEGVTDDADVVVQLISGVQGDFPRQTAVINVPTTLLLLDIALLRDADDSPGAYVAAYGPAPHWRGSVVYTSADGAVSWTRAVTMPQPGSAIGAATNALGNWTGGNVFDEANRLNVSLVNGTAESTTRLGVLNGGNALAIEGPNGWEVLQYRDAVLEDDGTYTLTGLLRGRRGTEYAMAGHAAGDRVVLLATATIRNMPIDSSVIGIERPYRAVSIGDTISETPQQDATVEAERFRPWSPVQLGGGREDDGDVVLKWRRRTRVGGEWRDSVDASLGESSEAYEVDIFTSSARSTVVRTISGLSSQSATYTAAQQTADFGAPQSTVYWAAYQMSETVGRGHVAHGTT